MKNNQKNWTGKFGVKYFIQYFTSVVMALFFVILSSFSFVSADTANTLSTNGPTTDITQSSFQLTACDGPDLSNLKESIKVTIKGQSVNTVAGKNPDGYIPCNFNGLMIQIQHLINIAVVAGVLIAIFGFCYAGFLYVTGGSQPGKRSQASEVFKKVGIGFILILGAWFIVYQILSWLAQPGYTALLGK